ncbi:asparagine synthase (glutamine-hydrolyzing) [Pollutibacter soli]|uniref:asparagine synthase (glutamine-hydrolyzing) n=1 Tax=Pollutibacter soli TaxID=3034157 RepID=UPI003013AD18
MCGLAGFVGFEDNLALAKMANECQQHRGPDNQSTWQDDYLAFAHQRLSIIDLSERSNQPFIKGNLVTVFNGEIYNYKELQEKLEKEKNVQFNTTSDTEVVVEMYRHYGIKALDELIGMFAFAIYNKDTKELFIARDHFGIKPIFYTSTGKTFAFSSELKTLTKIPGFDKTLNPKALVSCLNYIWISGNESMFRNCFKLPAAHYLILKPGKSPEIHRYWDLNDKKRYEGKTEAELVEHLDNVLDGTIKRHMVADVPVSSFLSGGLDSSLIAVCASELNKNLSTYTIASSSRDKAIEKMPEDEKYARKLADEFKLDHHEIEISPEIIRMLPQMVKTLDEPIGDPAAINTYIICQAAREKGVKVLLSGMGADELFGGYRRQKATLLALKFNMLPGFIRSLAVATSKVMPVRIGSKGFKFGRWAKRFLSFVSMPLDEAYMRSYSYYSKDGLKNLVTQPFKNAVDDLHQEHKNIFSSKYSYDKVNQICNTDINMFMLGLNLTYSDRASMAASVEVRVPFIDKLVIEEAMQIPGEYKIRNGESKYILKKAAEKHLPEYIIYRPKAAFGAPIRSWISNDLKGMVDDLLSEENIKRRGFLNYPVVKKIIDNDRKGIEDNAYQIYQFLTLELWCREFLDK